MKSVPIAIPAVALLAVLLVLSAPPAHAQKPAPGAAAPAAMGPAAVASPSGAGALRTFVSDRAAIPAEWAHAFVPFAFQYPSDWKIDPTATASGFFINVSRPVPGYPDGEASEIFAAFPFLAAESALESERASVAARWAEWMKQAWGFPSYSARPITVAGTTLPAFAFDGASDADETIWARLVIVPIDRVDGQVRGVGLIMVGSSLASEIRGIDDVGVRGGMATILASLRGGSAPGAVPSPQPAAYAGGQPAPQAYPAQPAPQAPATALRGSSASSGATSSTRSTGSSGGGLAALLGALTGAGSGGQGSANVSISAVMALLGGLGDAQTQSKLELIAQQLQGGAAEADIRVHLDSVLRSLGGGQGGGNLASLVEPILALLRGGSPAPAAMAAPMSGAPASAPAAGLKPGTAN
jgi:hypothetical protein